MRSLKITLTKWEDLSLRLAENCLIFLYRESTPISCVGISWVLSCDIIFICQCIHLLEAHEEDLTQWYFSDQKENLMNWLCVERVLDINEQGDLFFFPFFFRLFLTCVPYLCINVWCITNCRRYCFGHQCSDDV